MYKFKDSYGSLLITTVLLTFCLPVFAAFVQPEVAIKAASVWMNSNLSRSTVLPAMTQIVAVNTENIGAITRNSHYAETDNNLPALYIVYYGQSGYTVVSAEDNTIPILAYSFEPLNEIAAMPPAFKWWYDKYSLEINDVRTRKVDVPENQQMWTDLLGGNTSNMRTDRAMAPLGQAMWNQGFPYNELCPLDADGPGGRVYAGCVATAMGMVMKYWNSPTTGQGSNTYYESDYGTQTANFGATTYNWDNMPNSISSSNLDIAKLLYHAGVSVDMNYAPDGSGAQSSDAAAALRNNFRYPTATYSQKSNYSASGWISLLTAQLDNCMPMYYSGAPQIPGAGHAFLCDGYQNTDYFHFNFGWGGSANGYFYVNALNPGGSDFSYYQTAITNAIPQGYTIASPHIQFSSSGSVVGSQMELTLSTYPILPSWNVSTYHFQLDYDNTMAEYIGYSINNTISSNGLIEVSEAEPGLLDVTCTSANPLIGGGDLIHFNFIPREPGSLYFNALGMQYNSTALVNTGHLYVDVTAPVATLAQSTIGVINAMHVGLNEVATIGVRTSYILPSWNVTHYAFDLGYQPQKIEFVDISTDGTVSAGTTPTATITSPGVLHIEMDSETPLFSDGTLISVIFRAIGNTAATTVAQIIPSNFYYNQTQITGLSNGYIVLSASTANDDELASPVSTLGAYPNPFNPSTTISFATVAAQPVHITVYNLKGQLVRNLANETMSVGTHEVVWNGKDDNGSEMSSGIYFVRLQHSGQTRTIKVLMTK